MKSIALRYSVFRFSRSFFSVNESRAAAEGQSTKQKEQATPTVHDEDDSGQNTSATMLSILSALIPPATQAMRILNRQQRVLDYRSFNI